MLDQNMFIEQMLPGVTQRALTADEMAEYRRPFLQAGDDRCPTLQWAREGRCRASRPTSTTGSPPTPHG